MDCKTNLIEAKYHLSIAKRIIASYQEYPEKRFIIGTINESSIAAIKTIKCFLMLEKVSGGLSTFTKKVAPKYLEKEKIEHINKILKIKEAQSNSPIEFKKNEKIILLIDNEYRILTIDRLKEFVNSLDMAIKKIDTICRQI